MGWSTIPKVIKAVKIAKNLAERRKTFETMIKAVDKYTKSKTTKTSKIKRDAVIKGSKIHDKYEKLQKILDKNK